MAPRSTRIQSRHDQAVRKEAKELAGKGWRVKADIPGYDQPSPIGKDGRIPDIEASKAGATKLVEVETNETVTGHADQHSTFRRSAAQRDRTTFEVKEVDPK